MNHAYYCLRQTSLFFLIAFYLKLYTVSAMLIYSFLFITPGLVFDSEHAVNCLQNSFLSNSLNLLVFRCTVTLSGAAAGVSF